MGLVFQLTMDGHLLSVNLCINEGSPENSYIIMVPNCTSTKHEFCLGLFHSSNLFLKELTTS